MSIEFSHIDLGNILTMLTVFGSVLAGVYSLLNRLSRVSVSIQTIDRRIDDMETELKKQTDILIELAQTRERLNSSDKRMDELSKRLDEIVARLPR